MIPLDPQWQKLTFLQGKMVEFILFYMITRQFSSPKKSVPQKKAHIDRIPANMSLHFIFLRRNDSFCK